MIESPAGMEHVREGFLAELTDAALGVAARHGVRGTSVDQEIELWQALGRVVGVRPIACDDLAAELAEAAYAVALGRGFRGSFVEVRLAFWRAVRRVLRTSRHALRLFQAACMGTGGGRPALAAGCPVG